VERHDALRVCVAGISHKTAPLAVRERVTLDAGGGVAFAVGLIDEGVAVEALVLSTCNRTEVYLYTDDPPLARRCVTARLSASSGASAADVEAGLYWHTGNAAIAHLFRVVSGLDSLILGEDQIVAQVRAAYRDAREAGVIGVVFNRLFSYALSTGKRVRNATNPNGRRRSVSLTAVEHAQRLLGDLSPCTAVVLGTGETSELTARHLRECRVRRLVVAGRRVDAAHEIARRVGGTACSLHGLDGLLGEADVVISSTAAPHHLITAAQVRRGVESRTARSAGGRSSRPELLIVDLAVPRDVDPAVASTPGVVLVTIDDLLPMGRDGDALAPAQACSNGHQADERPAQIIEEELDRVNEWLRGLAVTPTLLDLRQHIESLRDRELERFAPRLGELTGAELEAVDALTRAIVRKILHEPTVRLKELAGRRGGYSYAEALRELFGLGVSGHDAQTRPKH
jgi:glutamyl-tRNA reductase